MRRRTLLRGTGAALLGAAVAARAAPAARVVIVGAGWAGLAAAHTLRTVAPQLALTLVDRQPRFACLPLSGAWLAGLDAAPAAPDLALADFAAARGLRFVPAEVRTIDRAARRVVTPDGTIDYDYALVAPGCEADPGAWFGDDIRAAAECTTRWSAGYAAHEQAALRQRLAAFAGGELVMTVPAPPLRCPPAPYERALWIAQALRRRGVRARLTLLDAGPGMPRYVRAYAEQYAGTIDFRPYVQVTRVDPFARTLESTDGTLRWDEALLLPPMHAGALAREAGLLARDAGGRALRWVAVEPDTLRCPHDERVWIAGDALHEVSPLFGAYAKTAQVAADLGAQAALQIAAAARGTPAGPIELPRGECHVHTRLEPPEQMRLDHEHRRRGDGLIVRQVRQQDNPQPRGEDRQWLQALRAQRLGLA